MHGQHIGALHVYVQRGGNRNARLQAWGKEGAQENSWLQATANVDLKINDTVGFFLNIYTDGHVSSSLTR